MHDGSVETRGRSHAMALVALAVVTALIAAASARAQGAASSTAGGEQAMAEFYKGKTVRLVVGAAPGAAYDFVGRAFAAHFGRYIPGNPTLVVENMPGAAGIIMMNQLYNRAPRDGTVLGMPLSGIVLERRLKALSRDGSNVHFDVARMSYLGTPAQQPQSIVVWHGSPFKSLADLQSTAATFGTTAPGTDSFVLPTMTNQLLGTRIKVVSGYKAVNDIFFAMEQGELQGACVLLSSLLGKADWVRENKARILFHFGAERIASLPDIPTAIELAPSEDARLMLRIYGSKFRTTYPIMLPPDVPSARIAGLRAAFDATMKDARFIADAKKVGVDVDPLGGDAIERLSAEIDAMPQPVIDRLRKLIE